jgi:peptidoglycan hydrolase-like protein with peptidoglycan-binding domain
MGEGPLPAPASLPPAKPTDFPGFFFVWPKQPAISGEAVLLWQRKLVELGYTLDADGVYGPESKSACIAFQRDHGLSADGIVGRKTWAATFDM